MNILQINKFLYPKGGDAIVTLNTGDLLRSKGHNVYFWGMKHSSNREFEHSDLFVDEVDFNTRSGAGAQLRMAGNMLYSLEAKRKIEALFKRTGKPDIVHLHNFAHQISPSIVEVFKRQNIPCVMTMHDYKMVCASYTLMSKGEVCERCTRGAYWNCFAQGCVKGSKAKSLLNTVEMYLHHKVLHAYDGIDIFISPSQFLKDKVRQMGLERTVEVLPNFIDINNYEPEYGSSRPVVGFIGRLSKEKGAATLIDAMTHIPEAQLKVMGDGPLREELQAKVRSRQMPNVEFLGHLSFEQLAEEIKQCRFIVCPSEWYENNPRSILEAFAWGRPVIGADIGGITELVRNNERGLTFPSGNTQELISAVKKLLSDQTLAVSMGQNARRWVEQTLTSGQHYRSLIKIYQSAKALKSKKNLSVRTIERADYEQKTLVG